MLVVLAFYRTCAALAKPLLHFTEGSLLAVQGHWNVQGIRLRTEGDRAPVFESRGAGTHVEFHADPRNLVRPVSDLARFRAYFDDVLIAKIRGVDELSCGAIELPKNAQLTHFEKGLAATGVDQDALEHLVHVLRITG